MYTGGWPIPEGSWRVLSPAGAARFPESALEKPKAPLQPRGDGLRACEKNLLRS